MIFKSPYSAFQVLVRSEMKMYHPATGVEINSVKPLTAEFGTFGGEFQMANPLTGVIDTHALINGHFFDSDSAAEQNGWSEEEKESVEATLIRMAREQPYLLAKVEFKPPAAGIPWKTYDTTPEDQIPQFAVSLGLVRETLAYESENQNRETIINQLLDAEPVKRRPGRPKKETVEQKEEVTVEDDPAAKALSITL